MKRPQDYETLTTLDISHKNLIKLPSWVSQCYNLKELNCFNNKITKIQNLPPALEILMCSINKITYLDNLPLTLKELSCENNEIANLDNLPSELHKLCCILNPFKYEFEATLKNIKYYNNKTN